MEILFSIMPVTLEDIMPLILIRKDCYVYIAVEWIVFPWHHTVPCVCIIVWKMKHYVLIVCKAYSLYCALLPRGRLYSHTDMQGTKQDIMPVYCMNMPARLDMNAISCNLNAFHEARTLLNCLKKLIHHGSCQWPWVQRSHVDRPN